ncbi:hypothetical protein LINPERPRIM_LOCUS41612, partial [Linum perenne]
FFFFYISLDLSLVILVESIEDYISSKGAEEVGVFRITQLIFPALFPLDKNTAPLSIISPLHLQSTTLEQGETQSTGAWIEVHNLA